MLNAVEINSSFHRPHRRATYERWAATVPDDFAFAVKMPKTITHEARLLAADALLDRFLEESGGLGTKRGPILIQLPPSLAFDPDIAAGFFAMLRKRTGVRLACEPRHPSWFAADADALLAGCRVARIAADPALVPAAALPGGWAGLAYFRMHGAPRIYYSDYDAERLNQIGRQMQTAAAAGAEVWCIFDNTADGHALGNALAIGHFCTRQ